MIERLDFSRFHAQAESHFRFTPGNTVTNAWGRGAGKSFFLRNVGWYEQVVKYESIRKGGVRIVQLMPTLEQTRRVHAELVDMELAEGGEWGFLGGKLNKQTWSIKFPNGSYVQWITAERAKFQRGLRADIVTADEVDDLEPELFDSIIKPFFSEPRSLKMMLLGGTPRRGRKGTLWKYWKDIPKIDRKRHFGIHATCWDAARAGVVDLDYVKQVQRTTPPEIFKREWECDADAAEGLVFPMFREGFHVREPEEGIQWTEIIHGADHGYEDPGVILTIGIQGHGRDATAWILDEVYEQHREPDWWLDQVKERVEWYPNAKWYPDSALPGVCKSWKRAGARVQEVYKGAGSVEDGVGVLQRWLHIHTTPTGREFSRLYVHPRCKNTIEEFGMYRRKRDSRNPDVVIEAIEDNNNHCFVAGTMVETLHGSIPIEQIKAGDQVLTRQGYFPVKAAGMTQKTAKVLRLTASNGATLVATPNHLFWTHEKEWVRLDTLRYGITLHACEKTFMEEAKLSYLKAQSTEGTPTQTTDRFACTTHHKKVFVSIASFGKGLTVRFRKAWSSITSMATQPTTLSKISNAQHSANTCKSMSRCVTKSFVSGDETTWRPFGLSPRYGTAQKLAKPGIAKTENLHGPIDNPCGSSAITASPTSILCAEDQLTAFAATLANLQTAERSESTTFKRVVAYAARILRATVTPTPSPVHVLAVEHFGEADVYDLTVDGPPEFFANGILVHNCMDSLRYALVNRFENASSLRNARFAQDRQ